MAVESGRITPGSRETVLLTHIESPIQIYVRTKKDTELFVRMSREMADHWEEMGGFRDLSELEALRGSLIGVKVDGEPWMRGFVQDLFRKGTRYVLAIFFLDSGRIVRIPLTDEIIARDMSTLPETIAKEPGLATECRVHGFPDSLPDDGETFKDILAALTKRTGGEVWIHAHPQTTSPILSVEVYDSQTRRDIGQVLRDYFYMPRESTSSPCVVRSSAGSREDGNPSGHSASMDNFTASPSTDSFKETLSCEMEAALCRPRSNVSVRGAQFFTLFPETVFQERRDWKVRLTFVMDPELFYVVLSEEGVVEALRSMEENVDGLAKALTPSQMNVQYWMVDAAVVALDPRTGRWERAKLLSHPHPETVNVDVLFVDHGNQATVPRRDVRQIRDADLELPMMAIPCRLKDAHPLRQGSGFSPAAAEFLESLMGRGDLVCFFHRREEGKYLVELFNFNLPPQAHASVVSVMMARNLVLHRPPTPHDLPDEAVALLTQDMAPSPSHGPGSERSALKNGEETDLIILDETQMESQASPHVDEKAEGREGAEVDVVEEKVRGLPSRRLNIRQHAAIPIVVSFVQDADTVYIQPDTETGSLLKLLSKIQEIYGNKNLGRVYYNPENGRMCVARFSEDGQYYRAEVISKVADDKFKVRFVDYGNTDEVPQKDLMVMDGSLESVPPFAMAFKLSGVPLHQKDIYAERVAQHLVQSGTQESVSMRLVNFDKKEVDILLNDRSGETFNVVEMIRRQLTLDCSTRLEDGADVLDGSGVSDVLIPFTLQSSESPQPGMGKGSDRDAGPCDGTDNGLKMESLPSPGRPLSSDNDVEQERNETPEGLRFREQGRDSSILMESTPLPRKGDDVSESEEVKKWDRILADCVGEDVNAVVSFSRSPSLFYAGLSKHDEMFVAVSESLAKEWPSRNSRESLSVGCGCMVEFMGEPYRAQVTGIDGDSVDIVFVDFGNEETTRRQACFQLPPGVADLPKLAIPCRLAGARPTDGEDWATDVKKKLAGLFEKHGGDTTIRFIEKDEGKEVCPVNAMIGGVPVLDLLAAEGSARKEKGHTTEASPRKKGRAKGSARKEDGQAEGSARKEDGQEDQPEKRTTRRRAQRERSKARRRKEEGQTEKRQAGGSARKEDGQTEGSERKEEGQTEGSEGKEEVGAVYTGGCVNVEIGATETVIMTEMGNPTGVYVSLTKNDHIFGVITEKLNSAARNRKVLASLSEGSTCMVFHYEEWLRGEILEVRDGGRSASVHAVDHGHRVEKTRENMFQLPDELLSIPKQTLLCHPRGVHLPTDPKRRQELLDSTEDKDVTVTFLKKMDDAEYEAKVTADGEDLAKMLAHLGKEERNPEKGATPWESVAGAGEGVEERKERRLTVDQIGKDVNVEIGRHRLLTLHPLDPGVHGLRFFIVPLECEKRLSKIQQLVNGMSGVQFEMMTGTPRPGDMAIAPYMETFYRCQVLRVDSGAGKADVSFIDYGNEETVDLRKMLEIPEGHWDILREPKCCVLCELNDLKMVEGMGDFMEDWEMMLSGVESVSVVGTTESGMSLVDECVGIHMVTLVELMSKGHLVSKGKEKREPSITQDGGVNAN